MSGSGRRRGSKWDMKEDISPENRRDLARSNNAGNSFHERESREYMSGRREFQRDDRMNEESMLGWDAGGHYTRRMSPGPDGRRQQSRSRSPRRSRTTSYKSKSRSRSRSPTHNNLQWEPSVHRTNSKSGHSASLCRDFASGRCKKGDECRFAHHTSPNHDSRRQFDSRTVDGWESRRGNDGASRHHSDPYSSGGRSNTNVCNEFLKGRCTRGASCKYRHHDSGSDEFGKRETDRSYRDGGNDWRNKRGSGYDNEAHISSEPICKFFAAGNCRNGKHCKFSHQRDGQFNHERRSPDGRRREHNLELANKVWNDDPNWGDRTSLRRVPGESGWDGEGNDFRDSRNSKSGDWSKDDLLNHQPADPNYMNHGNENMRSNGNQWERNGISVSEIKGIEKGFGEGKMLSPKGTFNSRIGHVDQRSDALPFSQISLPFGEQDTAQRASTENHYLSGINQPNISGDYLQPNPSFPIDITPGVGNNTSLHVNANIPTNFSSGQGISQTDSGYGPLPISADNVGQIQPTTFPIHQLGVENVQMAPHQPVLDSNLGAVQSQIAFAPHNQSEGLQIPHHQPIVDPNQADNLGSQATTGITLGQNSILNEQLVQYSNLSATLVQLLEKRQQLPQLYAAITQQTASVPTEPTKQYDPISDSVETKLPGSLAEQNSSIVGASELPPLNCNPSSIASGLINADPKTGSSGDELQHKDHELNEQEPAVSDKEENGQATENEANETQEALDPGPTDDMALDSGADENKKAKEAKGIRPFKFALAEFVKDLLKPVWKEGKMSKDVYKNIVKRVVDKVTDTIQVAHIPRTKEKIDQYLSLSKPKLNKLTQILLKLDKMAPN
ncbi:hypothetical protein V2J09_017296 [Rumex salicifolius]